MFRLQHDAIDPSALLRAVGDDGNGAALLFVGLTRDHFDGRPVVRLEYEAYEPLALKELEAIGAELQARHPGARVAIVHRLGLVPTGQASVMIAVSTPHRGECYEASRYAIEALKERVPIWKKEVYADGSAWKANTAR
jgi:molybdopterin synthase catalytic subunit